MKSWIHVVALLVLAGAVVIALAGADVRHPDANPISAVALALTGLALVKLGGADGR